MADRPTTGSQLPNSIARAWYGPGEALPPVATPGTLPRTYDYPWNLNINFAKRKYERISFEQMREMLSPSGNYLMRVILEKVKARLCQIKWEFRLRAQSGEHLAAARARSAGDPRVKFLYQFFERPDQEHDFPDWLNAILEERFVIDAATLWVARDYKDRIQALVPIDGSLINRVITDTGMTPAPPYAAYQQLVKGLPAINFTTEDIIYMPANVRVNKLFGYSEVEQTIRLGETQINRAIWALNHYTEGNIPELLLLFKTPQNGTGYTAEQLAQLMQTFEAKLNGQLGQRQRAFPLPDAEVHELRGKELFDGFDEWMARLFCYQLGEPPTALVKAVNRASAQQMDDTREESGERPYIAWIQAKLNRIIQNPLYFGFEDIEAAPMPDVDIDPLKQAQVWQITVPLGIDTVDEARISLGKAPEEEDQKQERLALTAAKQKQLGSGDEDESAKAASVKKKIEVLQPTRSSSLAVLPKPEIHYRY